MTEPACARTLISGQVQGVGFRFFVTSLAESFDVLGYVRNLETGSVEIEIEGEKNEIMNFLSEVRRGPSHSRIADMQVEWKPFKMQFDHFFVKY